MWKRRGAFVARLDIIQLKQKCLAIVHGVSIRKVPVEGRLTDTKERRTKAQSTLVNHGANFSHSASQLRNRRSINPESDEPLCTPVRGTSASRHRVQHPSGIESQVVSGTYGPGMFLYIQDHPSAAIDAESGSEDEFIGAESEFDSSFNTPSRSNNPTLSSSSSPFTEPMGGTCVFCFNNSRDC